MTVSEFIFDFLQKKGIDTVFMVSGSSAMWLTDSLKRNEKLEDLWASGKAPWKIWED